MPSRLRRSTNSCCRQRHGVQHLQSHVFMRRINRRCAQLLLKDLVLGKPCSAAGPAVYAADFNGQKPGGNLSIAVSVSVQRQAHHRAHPQAEIPASTWTDPPSPGGQAVAPDNNQQAFSSSSGQPSGRQAAGSPSNADPSNANPAGNAHCATAASGELQRPRPHVPRRPAAETSMSSVPHMQQQPSQPNLASRGGEAEKHTAQQLNSCIGACRSLSELQQLVEPKLHQDVMDVINIAAVWGRIAKLSSKQGSQPSLPLSLNGFRDKLACITLEELPLPSTRTAANIMHSLGMLRLRPANGLLIQLLGQLMANNGAMLRRATPWDLSNIAWSMARLVPLQQDEQLGLLRIADVAVSRLRLHGATEAADFNPQTISNLVWAYATAGLSAAAGDGDARLLQDLFHELATAALTKLPEFNAQNYANTAWAFAKVSHQHQELMVGIMQAAMPRLTEFKPQELSNLLWAMATLDCTLEPGFLVAWAQAVRQAADRFSAHSIANSLWALAKLRLYDSFLLRDLLLHANTKLSTFDTQAIANSLWALATLQHLDEAAVAAMATAAHGRLHEFDIQGLSSTLWALAALNFSRNTAVIEGLLQQLAATDASKLTMEDCTQVWQAWCWHGNVKGGQGRLLDRPDLMRMVDHCEQRAKANMASATTPSQAQLQVAAVLRAVLAERAAGLTMAQQQQHPVTHQVVHIVLRWPNGAWAAVLEVASESHYAVKKQGHLLGSRILRKSLLEAQRLPVITVQQFEWRQLKGKEAQKQYLCTKLDGLLAAAVRSPRLRH